MLRVLIGGPITFPIWKQAVEIVVRIDPRVLPSVTGHHEEPKR